MFMLGRYFQQLAPVNPGRPADRHRCALMSQVTSAFGESIEKQTKRQPLMSHVYKLRYVGDNVGATYIFV